MKPGTGHCFSNLWHPHPGLATQEGLHATLLISPAQHKPSLTIFSQATHTSFRLGNYVSLMGFNFHIMTRCLKVFWSSLRSPEEQRVRGGKKGRTPDLWVIFQPREFQRCLFCVLFFARTLSCAAKRQTNTHTHTKMPNNWKSLIDPQASSGSLGNQSWRESSTSPDSCLPYVLCDITRSVLILRDRELNARLSVHQYGLSFTDTSSCALMFSREPCLSH